MRNLIVFQIQNNWALPKTADSALSIQRLEPDLKLGLIRPLARQLCIYLPVCESERERERGVIIEKRELVKEEEQARCQSKNKTNTGF